MARPRAAQFAKDIGVSTNQAKKLINEGRRRKDSGSNVMEATMADAKEEKKKTKNKKMKKPKTLPLSKPSKVERLLGKRLKGEPGPFIPDTSDMKEPKGLSVGGMTVRGMGKAYMAEPRKVQIR